MTQTDVLKSSSQECQTQYPRLTGKRKTPSVQDFDIGKITPPNKRQCIGKSSPSEQEFVNNYFNGCQVNIHYHFDIAAEKAKLKHLYKCTSKTQTTTVTSQPQADVGIQHMPLLVDKAFQWMPQQLEFKVKSTNDKCQQLLPVYTQLSQNQQERRDVIDSLFSLHSVLQIMLKQQTLDKYNLRKVLNNCGGKAEFVSKNFHLICQAVPQWITMITNKPSAKIIVRYVKLNANLSYREVRALAITHYKSLELPAQLNESENQFIQEEKHTKEVSLHGNNTNYEQNKCQKADVYQKEQLSKLMDHIHTLEQNKANELQHAQKQIEEKDTVIQQNNVLITQLQSAGKVEQCDQVAQVELCFIQIEQDLLAMGYQNVHLIGQGGFGVVFKANKDKNKFAVKVSIRADCSNEIAIMIKLQQRGFLNRQFVAPVVEEIKVQKRPALVMHYYKKTLVDFIKESHSIEQIKVIFYFILRGVSAAHSSQPAIAHRDIKPANVLFTELMCPLISDWGLSSSNNNKYTGGTQSYMDPRIWDQWKPVVVNQMQIAMGGRSRALQVDYMAADVWSLGVMLFKMVEQEHPFKKDQLTTLKDLEKDSELSLVFKASDSVLQQLVMGMLKLDAKKRFTVGQVLAHPWFQSLDGQFSLFDNPIDLRKFFQRSEAGASVQTQFDAPRPLQSKHYEEEKNQQQIVNKSVALDNQVSESSSSVILCGKEQSETVHKNIVEKVHSSSSKNPKKTDIKSADIVKDDVAQVCSGNTSKINDCIPSSEQSYCTKNNLDKTIVSHIDNDLKTARVHYSRTGGCKRFNKETVIHKELECAGFDVEMSFSKPAAIQPSAHSVNFSKHIEQQKFIYQEKVTTEVILRVLSSKKLKKINDTELGFELKQKGILIELPQIVAFQEHLKSICGIELFYTFDEHEQQLIIYKNKPSKNVLKKQPSQKRDDCSTKISQNELNTKPQDDSQNNPGSSEEFVSIPANKKRDTKAADKEDDQLSVCFGNISKSKNYNKRVTCNRCGKEMRNDKLKEHRGGRTCKPTN